MLLKKNKINKKMMNDITRLIDEIRVLKLSIKDFEIKRNNFTTKIKDVKLEIDDKITILSNIFENDKRKKNRR